MTMKQEWVPAEGEYVKIKRCGGAIITRGVIRELAEIEGEAMALVLDISLGGATPMRTRDLEPWDDGAGR